MARTMASASSSRRHLGRVADVDGKMLARLCQQDQPTDEVVDETEAPRLGAVAEHGQRLLLERLANEGRDGTAVVRAHPRP